MLNNILNLLGKKDKSTEQSIGNQAFKPNARIHAPKITAIWGNPSSGKTVTAMKLAKELAANKKNVIVIFADIFCPVISTVMPTCDTKNRTLGSLLSKPTIKQSDIMEKAIPYPKNEYIAVIGYKNGDNIFTYSEFLRERVLDFFTQLRQIADYIIIDCSTTLTPIISKLSDMRVVSAELDYLLYEPMKEFITMAILLVGNIPLIYFLNKSWYHTLMTTVVGKSVLALSAFAIFVSLAAVIRLTRPIEYKR